jgi:phage recombination protein Bet
MSAYEELPDMDEEAVPKPQALVPLQPAVVMDEARLKLIGSTLAPDLTPAELRLFGEVAVRSGLDPFAKQIYAVKRKGKVTFQTSIDGYRSIAARTGEYDGQDEPTYEEPCPCGNEPKGHPRTATVRVYRHGMTRGVAATAFWHEYVPEEAFMWRKMPHVMLAKVAEALALRKAFPYVMAEVYTAEEMEQSTTAALNAGDSPVVAARAVEPAGDGTTAPDPAGDFYEGAVVPPLPDRVREVKRPDWFTVVPPETMLAKLELKFTVGRTKHTAILLGNFAYAVLDAQLTEGDTVRVFGIRQEVVWSEGKPTKKEVRFVTRVDVLRDGDWQQLAADEADDLPTPTSTETTDDVAEGDYSEVLDAKPAPTIEKLLALPRARAPEIGEDLDVELTLLAQREGVTNTKKRFLELILTDSNYTYLAIMDGNEADEQKANAHEIGELLRIVGVWQPKFILLTAVVSA